MLMRFDFNNDELANLAFATATGIKRGLKKNTKLAHQRLHLVHLFTPSGLHFSTLFMLFWPFFRRWKKTKNTRWLIPLFALALAPQLLTGFWAMKRIGLLKFTFLILKLKEKHISPFGIFLMVFALDFSWGTYSASPLSFSLSFLFLGLIFSSLGEGKLVFVLHLLLGQLVAGFFFGQPLFLLGFILGILMTGLFTLIYPFIFFCFTSAPWLSTSWLEPLLDLYLQLILVLDEVTLSISEGFLVEFSTIAIVISYILTRKKFLMFLIVFNASATFNLPDSHQSPPWYYQKLDLKKPTEISRRKKGYRLKTHDSRLCLVKLYGVGLWHEYCRYDWSTTL
jgi:competence protein ComEC